jgi:hypothetical protein
MRYREKQMARRKILAEETFVNVVEEKAKAAEQKLRKETGQADWTARIRAPTRWREQGSQSSNRTLNRIAQPSETS